MGVGTMPGMVVKTRRLGYSVGGVRDFFFCVGERGGGSGDER